MTASGPDFRRVKEGRPELRDLRVEVEENRADLRPSTIPPVCCPFILPNSCHRVENEVTCFGVLPRAASYAGGASFINHARLKRATVMWVLSVSWPRFAPAS